MAERPLDVAQLHRDLGAITAKLEAMKESQDRAHRDAADKRACLYVQIEAYAKSAQDMDRRLLSIEARMAEMEPFFRRLRDAEQRGIGALFAAGLIGGGAVGVIAWLVAYGKQLLQLVTKTT